MILQSPTPPQYVFWYHNSRMINYDTARGSVTVQTEPGPTQSRLTILHAVETDTGNYTCSASNTKPASIFVFVTEGKYISTNSTKVKFFLQLYIRYAVLDYTGILPLQVKFIYIINEKNEGNWMNYTQKMSSACKQICIPREKAFCEYPNLLKP